MTTNIQHMVLPFFRDARLSEYTTFRLGGPCRGLIHCETPQELQKAVQCLASFKKKFILIGGGSNLLVADQGIDCFVIRYESEVPLIKRDGLDFTISGSTSLDKFSKFVTRQGLEGLSYATGIPGTVGGAIVGNAGAFGRQVGDIVKYVDLLTREGTIKRIGPDELEFAYRSSILKKRDDIVSEVCFTLKPGSVRNLAAERTCLLKLRESKHPNLVTHPCAGSFFRNIEPTSKAGQRQAAGWVLDQAGGKSLHYGGAVIFQKHANIIIKNKGCTAQDIYELSRQMQQIVKNKFDIDLIREVRLVGLFKGESQNSQRLIF